jgi:hypothetical protein
MLPDRKQNTQLTLTGHDINGNLLWDSKDQKQYTSINQMPNSNVYAAKSMQLAGTLACDQNQYYLRLTSCSGNCRCIDHNTDADMETGYWGESLVKGAKGIVHAYTAGTKDLKKNLTETQTDLVKADTVLKVVSGQVKQIPNTPELKDTVDNLTKNITAALEEVKKALLLAEQAEAQPK